MNVRAFFAGIIECMFLFRKVMLWSVPVIFKVMLWSVPVIFMVAGTGMAEDGQDAALIRDIEDHLIAPCCWTQPISQHESAIAEQMREEVRSMVAAGKSREEILDHFVARYGERILATPRPQGFNLLVYILPWVALFLGAWVLFVLLKKMRTPAPAPPAASPPDDRYTAAVEEELKNLEEK